MHSTDAQSEPRNMMLGTPSQPQLPNQMRYLERQVNEILDLILSAVKFQSVQDLISICRVSRKFTSSPSLTSTERQALTSIERHISAYFTDSNIQDAAYRG
jgi:hypothetical protein